MCISAELTRNHRPFRHIKTIIRSALVPHLENDDGDPIPQFLIIPYKLGKRNKMEAQPAQSSRTEGLALRTAERMADRMHGVVVLKEDYDETADYALSRRGRHKVNDSKAASCPLEPTTS